MSASNWDICPVCKKKNDEKNKNRVLDAGKKYGKIPADEYIDLAKQVNKPIEIENTLREDYELGITEGGEFYVYYSCMCDKCGFEHEFEYKAQVTEQDCTKVEVNK